MFFYKTILFFHTTCFITLKVIYFFKVHVSGDANITWLTTLEKFPVQISIKRKIIFKNFNILFWDNYFWVSAFKLNMNIHHWQLTTPEILISLRVCILMILEKDARIPSMKQKGRIKRSFPLGKQEEAKGPSHNHHYPVKGPHKGEGFSWNIHVSVPLMWAVFSSSDFP